MCGVLHREPTCLADLLARLHKEFQMVIPTSEEEWANCPRRDVTIARGSLLQDALQEVTGNGEYDPTKLWNVSCPKLDHDIVHGSWNCDFSRFTLSMKRQWTMEARAGNFGGSSSKQ